LVCTYHVIGRENIPDPPCLIISNHMSYFDVPAMLIPSPKGLIGLAAQKYRHKLMGKLFSMYGLIWVDQFTADLSALRDALTVLKAGYPLAIAPEGTRSRTGALIQGRAGPAFLATRANVPVVPAAVWGTEKIFKHPRPAVYARFGKPYRLPEGRAKGPELDAYTERMMCSIAALMPEQYHGVYAGNPLIEVMRAQIT
jgi:1-acyl-sn-glycerol-3-phosphate acyltransferase